MRIVFELEPDDLRRFREATARAVQRVACAEECDIIDGAKHALDRLPLGTAPGFVRRQLCEVQRLILMVEDEAWGLPREDREQVLQALAYFSDPEDMIPDHIEVIGLIDDAIMLALMLRRLRHTLEAYDDFCAFRKALGPPPGDHEGRLAHAGALARQRQALHARMHERSRAECEEAAS